MSPNLSVCKALCRLQKQGASGTESITSSLPNPHAPQLGRSYQEKVGSALDLHRVAQTGAREDKRDPRFGREARQRGHRETDTLHSPLQWALICSTVCHLMSVFIPLLSCHSTMRVCEAAYNKNKQAHNQCNNYKRAIQ